MRLTAQNRFKALTSACVLSMMATVAWSQTLTWLGTLGGNRSSAFDVSVDGPVVVGRSYDGAGREIAFRWTRTDGMRSLGTLGGNHSRAVSVSANGNIIVGWAHDAAGRRRAFRWQNGQMQNLGVLKDWHYSSEALGISADGSVIVGVSDWDAFRWTQETGMQGLDIYDSIAKDVSDDGNVIVGYFLTYPGISQPFRWLRGSGYGSPFYDGALFALSADGTIAVGVSDRYTYDCNEYGCDLRWIDSDAILIRWSNGQSQTVLLNRLHPNSEWNIAYDVSADGSVVVGESDDKAVRWEQTGRVEDLNVAYANLLTNGSRLLRANAISRDGRYIVGVGYNAATNRVEAFLLDTATCTPHNGDADNNGCIDDADLLAVLFAFGSTGSDLGRVDVNCDQTVDDADLLQVLFNFGSGC